MNELNFGLTLLSNLHDAASNLARCLDVNVQCPDGLLTILHAQ